MDKLKTLAEQCMKEAMAQGAEEVAVHASNGQSVQLQRRDGHIELVRSGASQSVSLGLFVDGRYSSNSTSVLAWPELKKFIADNIALTRAIAPDPLRRLPEPALYGTLPDIDLDLYDASLESLDIAVRHRVLQEAETAARETAKDALISVTTELHTSTGSSVKLHSNGFCGTRRGTWASLSASATVRGPDDRRPDDYGYCGARHWSDVIAPASVGQEAAQRAMAHIGAAKRPSQTTTIVVENRTASRLLGALIDLLSGSNLQQKRSCLEGKLGEKIGSDLLTVIDNPLIVRGSGSHLFDGDGMAAKKMPLFDSGHIKNWLIDVYYGRKLNLPPTTGGTGNILLTLGKASTDELIRNVKNGIFITNFLGGNVNSATGAFSLGIYGQQIENGTLTKPVAEMNMADNHLTLWHKLVAVGSEPYRYSSYQLPALVFENIALSGL